MCEAWHGSTHAVYPAHNKLGRDLDNVQPLQYQQNRNAIGFKRYSVCHVDSVEDMPDHHFMRDAALIEEM
nr:hypothetical protein [uncultured Desulfobacter sp.]